MSEDIWVQKCGYLYFNGTLVTHTHTSHSQDCTPAQYILYSIFSKSVSLVKLVSDLKSDV